MPHTPQKWTEEHFKSKAYFASILFRLLWRNTLIPMNRQWEVAVRRKPTQMKRGACRSAWGPGSEIPKRSSVTWIVKKKILTMRVWPLISHAHARRTLAGPSSIPHFLPLMTERTNSEMGTWPTRYSMASPLPLTPPFFVAKCFSYFTSSKCT